MIKFWTVLVSIWIIIVSWLLYDIHKAQKETLNEVATIYLWLEDSNTMDYTMLSLMLRIEHETAVANGDPDHINHEVFKCPACNEYVNKEIELARKNAIHQ